MPPYSLYILIIEFDPNWVLVILSNFNFCILKEQYLEQQVIGQDSNLHPHAFQTCTLPIGVTSA